MGKELAAKTFGGDVTACRRECLFRGGRCALTAPTRLLTRQIPIRWNWKSSGFCNLL